jgi:RND superfamily putative drug exporter
MPIIQTYNRLTRAFPGGPHPAQVVISASDVTTPRVQAAIADLRRRALATNTMFEPVTVDVNAARSAAVVNIPIAGDGSDRTSQNAVNLLRSTLVPSTVGSVGTAYVAGPTASSMDFNHQLRSRVPFVFAFVLGMAFLILMWTFRSLTIAATTVVLNLLSVAAAYGALVAGFQWGWLQHLLHFTPTGAIASYLPLFLFVILFGLSMDYHVFVLSRVREEYLSGYGTREAVRRGVSRSAGVITSAAIIMVAVFGTWTTVGEVALKELGFGLATAVLLDATVVRGVLLPAVMSLLGERNWYMPRWLRRIPSNKRNEVRPPTWSALPPPEPAWTRTR